MAADRRNSSKSPPEIDTTRRRLLLAGAGGAVTASTASFAATGDPEAPAEQIKGRYRVTPHVERFYFLNRL